jgi:hypothetical protein
MRICFLYSGVCLAECGPPQEVISPPGIFRAFGGQLVQCEVLTSVTMRTMSRVAPKLRRALELLRLSYRLSFSAAEVNSLLLVGFTNVWTLLPHALGQIPINIPGPTHGRLVDIHICHCSLPTGTRNLPPPLPPPSYSHRVI